MLSVAGKLPKVRYWTMVAVRFCTFMGQPGRLMTVALGTTSETPVAPVGPPFAPGRPPSKAQDPTAIVARALPQTSSTMDQKERPPTVQ